MIPDETAWKEEADGGASERAAFQSKPDVTLREDQSAEILLPERVEPSPSYANLPSPTLRNGERTVAGEPPPGSDSQQTVGGDGKERFSPNWSAAAAYLWRRCLAAIIDACVMGVVDIFIFWAAFAIMSCTNSPYDQNIVWHVKIFVDNLWTRPEGQFGLIYALMFSSSSYLVPVLMPLFWIVLVGRSESLFGTPLIVAMVAVCVANLQYSVLQEHGHRRATIGQRLLGLAVCTLDAKQVPLPKLILRNFCVGLSLPFTLCDALFGFPSASQGQSFPDLAVRTCTVQGYGTVDGIVALTSAQLARVRMITVILTTVVLSALIYGIRTFHTAPPAMPPMAQPPPVQKPPAHTTFGYAVLGNSLVLIDQPGAHVAGLCIAAIDKCYKDILALNDQHADSSLAPRYWNYYHEFLVKLALDKTEHVRAMSEYDAALRLCDRLSASYRPSADLWRQLTTERADLAR